MRDHDDYYEYNETNWKGFIITAIVIGIIAVLFFVFSLWLSYSDSAQQAIGDTIGDTLDASLPTTEQN